MVGDSARGISSRVSRLRMSNSLKVIYHCMLPNLSNYFKNYTQEIFMFHIEPKFSLYIQQLHTYKNNANVLDTYIYIPIYFPLYGLCIIDIFNTPLRYDHLCAQLIVLTHFRVVVCESFVINLSFSLYCIVCDDKYIRLSPQCIYYIYHPLKYPVYICMWFIYHANVDCVT